MPLGTPTSGISDPLTGGHDTLKVYKSEKAIDGDESWRHAKITLEPLNANFDPIVDGGGRR